MKHRGTVILLGLLVAAAGVMSVELVRAADEELDLGGPVVVSPSSSPSAGSASRPVRTGDEGSVPDPVRTGTSEPARTGEASPGASPGAGKSGEPGASVRPSPRKTKAEPVKPPSPRPGGGDDDDDDDDGGGDDGDD
ncbi:hypothetical protein [Nonomuraea rubra]|uniref:Uncharacterized protein n=1 Tax=Nonomuraea rubra TaxID=46180 RepID=A0A7X0P4T9_9ACTN|nr:hypothetical protein [Nonomuraea rubra]MBB6555157.1 hypothetical protein [Nonomuraea rubra]